MTNPKRNEPVNPHRHLQDQYKDLLGKYQQAVEERSHSHWLGSWLIHEAQDGVVLICGEQIRVANRSFYALAASRRRWVSLDRSEAPPEILTKRLLAAADALQASGEACSTHYFRTLEVECRVLEARFHRLEQKPGQTAVLLRDISERELLRLQIEEVAQRDRFMAVLAHELRNPLSPIVAAAELILRGSDQNAMHRAAEIILRQARHQARLVDDLLDVARVRQGKIVLRRQWHDLRVLVREAADATEEHRLHSDVGLVVDLPSDPVWAWVDATRIVQCIVNLLVNAAKFTLPGANNRLKLEPGDEIARIQVQDEGIGIDPPMLNRIFELFTQADESLDHARGGLGLGLPLVRTLVELHGGGIRAASEGLGQGAEFTLWLPTVTGEPHRALLPEAAGASLPAVPELGLLERSRFVLVVEDNTDARESLCELLESVGHEVVSACDGLSALELVRKRQPEVVISDIGLPGIDGFELARRLRRETSNIRLIALSGYSQFDDRQCAEEAGFDMYLVKPFDTQALMLAIASL